MAGTGEHGPLPRLLIVLTVVRGLVDAFGYLALGHVFVANMTGNVVFFGFALAGVGGVPVVASLVAILAFAVGAGLGGRLAREPARTAGTCSPPRASPMRYRSWPRRSWSRPPEPGGYRPGWCRANSSSDHDASARGIHVRNRWVRRLGAV
ncbi:YoaK family protein [Actinoplanes sp. NPDC026623]|uniref:YoaK family protein n=1 Tax=Actinoplanes sp. NPDC026623 TaxID=3155610 RepID=UPI0033E30517